MNKLYDEIVKSVELSADEVDLMKELLFYRLNKSISVGEELTVRGLLEKLEDE